MVCKGLKELSISKPNKMLLHEPSGKQHKKQTESRVIYKTLMTSLAKKNLFKE